MSSSRSETARRTPLVLGIVSLCLGIVFGLGAATASAAPKVMPKSYTPVEGENTFDAVDDSSVECPEGIAGTPGSDPASKKIDFGDSDLDPGGTIHYYFDDNPNRTDEDFNVQDCVVVYPSTLFTGDDFNDDGQLINPDIDKNDLTKSGEVLDAADLTGSADSTQEIHFNWTSPETVTPGDWVCNFARDINNQHQGEGNRKVLPTCYQVPGDNEGDPEVIPADVDIERGNCNDPDTYTIPTRLHVEYFVDDAAEPTEAGDYPLAEGDSVKIEAEATEGYVLADPPEGKEKWVWKFDGSSQDSCSSRGGGGGGGTTTTSTTTTLPPIVEPEELAFVPEPEVLPEVITTTTAPVLPFTGNDNGLRLAAVATSLMTLGGVLVLASRRRLPIQE